MEVNFFNQTTTDFSLYEKVITSVFQTIDNKNSMQIIFVDNAEIKVINQTYRNIDKATDVISFPNDDPRDDSVGDIFISVEQAIAQASAYGHSIEREIGFLAVHGYLHLIGYDHETESEEKEMFDLQESILNKANLTR